MKPFNMLVFSQEWIYFAYHAAGPFCFLNYFDNALWQCEYNKGTCHQKRVS